MKAGSFFASLGAGAVLGALGVMMLPKNGEVYKMTKEAADAIRHEAGKAMQSMSAAQ